MTDHPICPICGKPVEGYSWLIGKDKQPCHEDCFWAYQKWIGFDHFGKEIEPEPETKENSQARKELEVCMLILIGAIFGFLAAMWVFKIPI